MTRSALLLLLILVGMLVVFLRAFRGGDSATGVSQRSDPTPASVAAARVPVQVERESVTPSAAARKGEPSEDWVGLNNQATELLDGGNPSAALPLLERCVEGDPTHAVFRSNLAEALARLAREDHARHALEEGLDKLARAQQLAPDRIDIAALLEHWRLEAELESNHWSEGSDLFELSYDTRRVEILWNSQALLDHLERAYEELRLWFALDPVRDLGRDRIRVVLYRALEFDRLTGLGDWAGGVFDGVVRVSVDDFLSERARWSRILTHELVHAFLHEIGGKCVPGWLNEGLAQLLETERPDLEGARRRMGPVSFPLERLRASLAGWEDPREIARAYAQSLTFVSFLREEYGDEALRQMVIQCGEGLPVEQSFERWTSVPLDFAFGAYGVSHFPPHSTSTDIPD